MESLSSEDAALLYAEDPGVQLQIGALCLFEGARLRDRRGRLRIAALRSHVDARLAALPRFRQRIAPVLGDLAAPMWVDDTDFDIARHVKHVALPLPLPDGAQCLPELMDHLLGEPMDMAHPLWDIHVVEGAGITSAGGDTAAVAVIVRAHHVMADGIALHAAATLLLDSTPHPPRDRARDRSVGRAPGSLDITAAALVERTRRQSRLALDITRLLIDPRRALANARLVPQVIGAVRRSPGSIAPALPFTRPVGRRRAFAWDSVPMSDLVAVKRACGGTVNDVVLAIVTGALRRMTEATGSFDPAGREPRAIVPVGSQDGDPTVLHNRFSVTSVALPVGVDDPLERVRLIHARMQGRRTAAGRSIMPQLFSIADVVAPPVLRFLIPRLLAHQPFVNLAVSNISGSRAPLFMLGSPMLALHPFIDVVGNVALIVGVLSYVEDLGIGITVDPDVVGEPAVIGEYLRAALAELVDRLP